MVQHRLLALIAAFIAPAVPAAAQLQPRTIELKGIFAEGAYIPLAPRTIDLEGIYAEGFYFPLKPLTIELKAIIAAGGYAPFKPQTIELKGITASGLYVQISKAFQLTGWTASPPTLRGKRF
jgi:hypothetical protein